MRVLVVNVGSSSLKVSVVGDGELIEGLSIPVADMTTGEGQIEGQIERLLARHGPFDAVGNRVVHGGTEFVAPVVVDQEVRRRLAELVDLAPLHMPRSLEGLDLAARLVPGVPSVACFDTAFHANLPESASTYALPAEWRRRWPLRRFGFHGLSHSWTSRRAAELTGRPLGTLRTVTCHLGAGASLAAVHKGVCVDTTMGFTPLEGLVMATRSGSVDPGLVLWLEEHVGVPPAELASTLEHRSGLLGLAGSADMAWVLDAEARGSEEARLAVEVYVHRLRAAIGAMAASLGGLDALVFTGGVGERAPAIRSRAAARLSFLGVGVDEHANTTVHPDADISDGAAAVRTLVVEASEDLEIFREVEQMMGAGPQTST
jgi:acetate kinase